MLSFCIALLAPMGVSNFRRKGHEKANGCLMPSPFKLSIMVVLCHLAIVVHGKDFVQRDSVVVLF
jgi:hypothetical protein